MHLIEIFAGVTLLFYGRRLFWLFIAALGFVVAARAGALVLLHQPEWMRVALALSVGVAGGVSAILVQKAAIAVAGFVAGGFFFLSLLSAWSLHDPARAWISFVVGGIAGALLMMLAFEWTLIVLSCATAAHLIVTPFHLTQPVASTVYVVLMIVGVGVQAMLRRSRPINRG